MRASRQHLLVVAPLAAGLLPLVAAVADNLNPTGAGCVDPSGYLSCYQKNANDLTTCINTAKTTCSGSTYSTCVQACGGVQLAANLGCWLTSCWNQVYSCGYQGTVVEYLDGTDRLQGSINIPYYPAPDNAPGRCVCNLGYIWGNVTVNLATNEGNPCGTGSNLLKGLAYQAGCQCCWFSSILSNIIDTCPSNDLSLLGLDRSGILSDLTFANNISESNNCEILNDGGSQCDSVYGIDTFAKSYYNPGALPSGFPGTATLSDLDGSITSAPTPFTLTLFPGFTSAITPVPYKKPSGSNVLGGTSAAGTGGGASAGASASPTPGTNAAGRPVVQAGLLGVTVLAVLYGAA